MMIAELLIHLVSGWLLMLTTLPPAVAFKQFKTKPLRTA